MGVGVGEGREGGGGGWGNGGLESQARVMGYVCARLTFSMSACKSSAYFWPSSGSADRFARGENVLLVKTVEQAVSS